MSNRLGSKSNLEPFYLLLQRLKICVSQTRLVEVLQHTLVTSRLLLFQSQGSALRSRLQGVSHISKVLQQIVQDLHSPGILYNILLAVLFVATKGLLDQIQQILLKVPHASVGETLVIGQVFKFFVDLPNSLDGLLLKLSAH